MTHAHHRKSGVAHHHAKITTPHHDYSRIQV